MHLSRPTILPLLKRRRMTLRPFIGLRGTHQPQQLIGIAQREELLIVSLVGPQVASPSSSVSY